MQTTIEQTEPKPLQLEERQCPQRGRSFRVLITSSQVFCSKPCQEDSPLKRPKPKKVKPWASLERDKLLYGAGVKTKPKEALGSIIRPEPEPEPTIIPPIAPPPPSNPTVIDYPEPTTIWDDYVTKAKSHLVTLNQKRMLIADLAIRACEINWGGGDHWKKFEGVYTLKKFAEEIGVHYKTLSQWCAVKRLVKDKLPDGLWKDDDYTAALRTQNKVDRGTEPKVVAETYEQEISKDKDQLEFHKCLTKLKFTRHLVSERIELDKIDPNDVTQVRDLCAEIERTLTDFLTRTDS